MRQGRSWGSTHAASAAYGGPRTAARNFVAGHLGISLVSRSLAPGVQPDGCGFHATPFSDRLWPAPDGGRRNLAGWRRRGLYCRLELARPSALGAHAHHRPGILSLPDIPFGT